MPTDNSAHLERVSSRIGEAIMGFCRDRLWVRDQCGAASGTFRVDDLRRWVALYAGPVAPASPDRVLRQLRKDGKVEYRVVDRAKSLYEVVSVTEQKGDAA